MSALNGQQGFMLWLSAYKSASLMHKNSLNTFWLERGKTCIILFALLHNTDIYRVFIFLVSTTEKNAHVHHVFIVYVM